WFHGGRAGGGPEVVGPSSVEMPGQLREHPRPYLCHLRAVRENDEPSHVLPQFLQAAGLPSCPVTDGEKFPIGREAYCQLSAYGERRELSGGRRLEHPIAHDVRVDEQRPGWNLLGSHCSKAGRKAARSSSVRSVIARSDIVTCPVVPCASCSSAKVGLSQN